MKKTLYYSVLLLLCSGIIILSCKKNSGDQGMFGKNRTSGKGGAGSLSLVNCSQTLPSTITVSRTLNSDSAYIIPSCVKVQNGATLTIPAGTVLHGQKSTNGTLVIERGAKLVANGTAMNPIIFTSDQPANSRAAGDWGGIIILGKADNNSSSPSTSVIEIDRACGTLVAGRYMGNVNDNDDSGSMSYVQIHYAGGAVSGDELPSALLLAAVGDNTDIDHIQITNSKKDGLIAYGGTVNTRYVANYDNYKADFRFEEGYRGNLQYGLSLRLNSAAHDATGIRSNAVVIRNDEFGTSSTPFTNAVLSNVTIYGPQSCGASSVNSDFRNAVLFGLNAKGGVWNSVITGWPQGLFVDGDASVENANNEELKFSYNTFYDFASTSAEYAFNATASNWNQPSGACVSTMVAWVENPLSVACANFGYQSLSSGLGKSGTVCGDLCDTSPNFLSSSTSVSNSEYPIGSMVDIAFFNSATQLRGGFNSSDWTSGWTVFCPQQAGYCL